MNNKTVQIGYTPNDFFYNKFPSYTLSDSICNQLYDDMSKNKTDFFIFMVLVEGVI